MPVVNIKDLKTKHFSPHGGKGKINMKFAHSRYKNYGKVSNWEFFGHAIFPVGTTAGLHKHEGNDEWFYVLEGKAELIINKKKYKIKRGDVILTLDGNSHDIVNVTEKLVILAIEVETKK